MNFLLWSPGWTFHYSLSCHGGVVIYPRSPAPKRLRTGSARVQGQLEQQSQICLKTNKQKGTGIPSSSHKCCVPVKNVKTHCQRPESWFGAKEAAQQIKHLLCKTADPAFVGMANPSSVPQIHMKVEREGRLLGCPLRAMHTVACPTPTPRVNYFLVMSLVFLSAF